MSGSKRWRVDGRDLRKWGTGATIAALGAVGAYFSTEVVPGLEGTGKEELSSLFVILCMAISFARKLLTDGQQPEPPPEPAETADTDIWERNDILDKPRPAAYNWG